MQNINSGSDLIFTQSKESHFDQITQTSRKRISPNLEKTINDINSALTNMFEKKIAEFSVKNEDSRTTISQTPPAELAVGVSAVVSTSSPFTSESLEILPGSKGSQVRKVGEQETIEPADRVKQSVQKQKEENSILEHKIIPLFSHTLLKECRDYIQKSIDSQRVGVLNKIKKSVLTTIKIVAIASLIIGAGVIACYLTPFLFGPAVALLAAGIFSVEALNFVLIASMLFTAQIILPLVAISEINKPLASRIYKALRDLPLDNPDYKGFYNVKWLRNVQPHLIDVYEAKLLRLDEFDTSEQNWVAFRNEFEEDVDLTFVNTLQNAKKQVKDKINSILNMLKNPNLTFSDKTKGQSIFQSISILEVVAKKMAITAEQIAKHKASIQLFDLVERNNEVREIIKKLDDKSNNEQIILYQSEMRKNNDTINGLRTDIIHDIPFAEFLLTDRF